MKLTFVAAALAAAILSVVPARDANAGSNAMYAGSGCKVFGTTAWTDLLFGARGISNTSASPKNIICPIVKESEGDWDAAADTPINQASVHFHVTTGNNTLMTACNVYVVDAEGTLMNTYSIAVGGVPNAQYNQTFSAFQDNTSWGGDHNMATMLCTLAPGARLNFYQLYEGGTTTF
ncbi:hypothetical protein AB4059_01880 [Lysobacter sp. 2RAF19]